MVQPQKPGQCGHRGRRGHRIAPISGRSENPMDAPQRKAIRLAEYDYSTPGYYFVTICSRGKANLFWASGKLVNDHPTLTPSGKIVRQCIQAIPLLHSTVRLDQFSIMPNHIHLILEITSPGGITISNVIAQLKRKATILIGTPIWQRNYYDHVIRSEADYQRIWTYVVNNHWKWREDCYYTQSSQL